MVPSTDYCMHQLQWYCEAMQYPHHRSTDDCIYQLQPSSRPSLCFWPTFLYFWPTILSFFHSSPELRSLSAALVFSFRSTLSRRSLSFSLFKSALQTQPDLFSTTTTNYYAQSQSPTHRPSPRHVHPIQTHRDAQGAKLVFESQWTADPFDVSVFLSSRHGNQ